METIALVFILLVVTGVSLTTRFGFNLRFDPSRSKLFVALATYGVSLLTVGFVAFALAMVIAGPHSGFVEPGPYSQAAFLAALSAVVIVPPIAVYRALHRR